MATYPVWHLSRHGKRHALRTRSRLASNDIDATMHAALQGVGVAYCADWVVANELREKRLVEVLSSWEVQGEEAMYVVRPSAQYTPAKVRAFIDWMAQAFEHPPWAATTRKRG